MKSWPIGKTKFAKEIGLEGLSFVSSLEGCKESRQGQCVLVKRDIDPIKGFEDGGKIRGIKLILVQWETEQPTRDFNHSLICFLISGERGYGLYHLLPRYG